MTRSNTARSKGFYWLIFASLFLIGCPDPPLVALIPCTLNGVRINVQQTPTDQVDILFIIDTSRSMLGEQEELGATLDTLIDVLLSGDSNGDGEQDFAPIEDLHLGVVSSDMGVGAEAVEGVYEPPPSCSANATTRINYSSQIGEDGLLQRGAYDRCRFTTTGTTPQFLSYDPDAEAFDGAAVCGEDPNNEGLQVCGFTCYSKLGSEGCGFEQQLEAGLKALTPSDPGPDGPTFLNGSGHGDTENAGFLRDDSVLALIFVTDEGDCSSQEPLLFENPSGTSTNKFIQIGQQLRCSEKHGFGDTNEFPDVLYPVDRYVKHFLSLRKDPSRLVFGAITGVPDTDDYFFELDGIRQVDYARLLAHPNMEEIAIDICDNPSGGMGVMPVTQLRPACGAWPAADNGCTDVTAEDVNTADFAQPARRIVKVARGLDEAGANTVVQSICHRDANNSALLDFTESMATIGRLIADAATKFCLPRDLEPTEGLVECDVVELLPSTGDTTTCDQVASKGRTFLREEDGRQACKVTQLPVIDNTVSSGVGWYYDKFSDDGDRVKFCGEDGQRIAFTEGAEATIGAQVLLECVSNSESSPGGQGSLGAKCSDNDPCPNTPVNGELFCEPTSSTCQYACTETEDCPSTALQCDTNLGMCFSPGCN